MTIEQAVLQGRLDNFENFKNNYIAAINEMIAALERLNNTQDIAEGTVKTPRSAGYELGSKISDIASGIAGALSKAEKNKSAVDAYNQKILAKVEKLQQSGKDVYLSKGDDNKLHWSIKSASKANELAGGANNAVKVSSKTPVQYTTSSGKTITTKPKSTGKGKGKGKGKASGSHSLPTDAMYRINELGDELLIPPTGNLAYLTKGTGVIPAHLTDNLMDLGRYNMSQWAKVIGNASAGNTTDSHDIIIQHMTVKSDNANDFVRQLQNLSILKK